MYDVRRASGATASRVTPQPGDEAPSLSFVKRATVSIGIAVLILAFVALLWYTAYVLMLAFAGVLLAIFLRTLGDWTHTLTRLPETWSLALAMIVVVGVIGIAAWVLTPRVAVQVDELRTTLPAALTELNEYIQRFQWGQIAARELDDLRADGELRESIPALAAGAAWVANAATSGVVAIVVVLFIGIYLAIQPSLYINAAVRLVPQHRRGRAREVLNATGTALRYWLIGRVIAMAFVGVTTALGLWLLDVPLSLTLGIFAALLDFVPNIGPLIAAVPAVILAFAESPQTALYVIILYFAIQAMESYIVTPIVQQKAVSLPPAFTVFVQLLFFVLIGPLGLLLATPLAAAGLVIVRGLYIQDALGDREVSLAL